MKTGEECKVCGYTARMDSLECLECCFMIGSWSNTAAREMTPANVCKSLNDARERLSIMRITEGGK